MLAAAPIRPTRYAVPADRYTPFATLARMPGLGLRYASWVNGDPALTVPHPEYPAERGGLAHLTPSIRAGIELSRTVPPHRCCSDPTWLYRFAE